ncbi:hypothetical protein Scep_022685 [Stephania cephalantha]|uniref:Uncharacterized protein n=1 Tax=Stephania cephalantha TaxID=152367 RepID=A0AAP0I2C8_9MAGN
MFNNPRHFQNNRDHSIHEISNIICVNNGILRFEPLICEKFITSYQNYMVDKL